MINIKIIKGMVYLPENVSIKKINNQFILYEDGNECVKIPDAIDIHISRVNKEKSEIQNKKNVFFNPYSIENLTMKKKKSFY